MNLNSNFHYCAQKPFTVFMVLVSVVCLQATTLTGVVFDSTNGYPIPNTEVQAREAHYVMLGGFPFSQYVGPRIDSTDDSGRFSIELDSICWLSGWDTTSSIRKTKIRVSNNTHHTEICTLAYSLDNQIINDTFFLSRNNGVVEGNITYYSTNIPVIGANVVLNSMYYEFRPLTELNRYWEGPVLDSTVTDSGGHYHFSNVADTLYLFEVTAINCRMSSGSILGPFFHLTNNLLTKDYQMTDTSTFGLIKGRVLDSVSGVPIDNITVTLTCNNADLSQKKITADSGYFNFKSYPWPNFTLTASSDSFYTKELKISLTAKDTITNEILLNAKPSKPLLIKYTPNPENNKTLLLCWNMVNGASDYIVEVDDNPYFSTPILFEKTGDTTSFTIKGEIPVGKLYWHVSSNLDFNWFSKIDSFTVTDGPIGLVLSKSYIELGAQTNFIVGLLSTVGSMSSSDYHYSLVAGDGDIDNARFYIHTDTLITATTIDSTDRYFFHIRIKSVDKQNRYHEEPITISNGQNIAFHKLTTASGVYTANPPNEAVDGDTINGWAVDQSGAWMKVDFQGIYTIRNIKMKIHQTLLGNTTFKIYGYSPTGDSSIIHTFDSIMKDQWLVVNFDSPISGQTAIKVLVPKKPSAVVLSEIIVMGTSDIIPTANGLAEKNMRQVHEFSIKTVPFSSNRIVLINLPEDSRIRIINPTGRIVQDFGYLKQGQHLLEFKNQNIAYGCFFIEAKMAHECKVKKTVILH